MAAGRRSVVREAAAPHAKGRAAIWAALRQLRSATVRELMRTSFVPERTIRSYLEALEAAGIVTRAEDRGPGGGARYVVARDAGHEPPRLRSDGTPVTQGSGRDRMWRSMKMLKVFTARDLAVTASVEGAAVSEGEARAYLVALKRAGYVVMQVPASTHPKAPRRETYRFAHNTGPLAPMVTRLKSVWDPNERRIVWHAEPRA